MENKEKAAKNPMTKKDNGLSSAQEVTYQDEFKKAENIGKDEKNKQNDANKK